MLAHREYTQMQPLSDIETGFATGDQSENFAFTGGDGDLAVGSGLIERDCCGFNDQRQSLADIGNPRQHQRDRMEELAGVFMFEQVTMRPGFKRSLQGSRLGISGENQYAYLR